MMRCSGAQRARLPRCGVALLAVLVAVVLVATASSAQAQDEAVLHKQRERLAGMLLQANSLSPPLLRTQQHGDSGVSHWHFNGATVVTDKYVRLTPDTARSVGQLWNRNPLPLDSFELLFGFRVHKMPPSSSSSGAEGFALWLTTAIPRYDGALMGHPMQFTGLGIVFDTYDNDGMHDNPNVLLLYNDNNNDEGNVDKAAADGRSFTPSRDFRNEYAHSCRFDYRDFTGASYYTARLRYTRGELTLYLADGDPASERLCFHAPSTPLQLPHTRYYVGFTAATSELSEAHDIVFVHTAPLS